MKNLIRVLIIFLFCNCQNKSEKSITNSFGNYTIYGNVSLSKDSLRVVLTKIDSRNFEAVNIDSTFIVDDLFKFNGTISNPSEYMITIIDSKANAEKRLILWLEDKEIYINGNFDDFQNSKIKGSPLNEISKQYRNIFETSQSKMNEELNSVIEEKDKKIIYDKYFNLESKEQLEFIYETPNNYISLSEIVRLKNRISKDSLQLYYNRLDTIMQNSLKGNSLKNFITSDRIMIGNHFIDFEAIDLKGNIVKLSDFRGKVILLDFWAYWCHWCHIQNKEEFSYLYKKYKNQDVIIISYSLDTNKKNWKKSSEDDKIDWVNISNLYGMDDPVALYFNIQALPNSFLIDQNGIIVKSFRGYDPENNTIEKEIDKLLNN